MARFLVDESLRRQVTRALLAAGHDALDVRDLALRGASDQTIVARAVVESRIVVSADLDFGNALRFRPGSHPGIVVLRARDEWRSTERASRLLAGLDEVGPAQISGAIVIIEPTRTRVFRAQAPARP